MKKILIALVLGLSAMTLWLMSCGHPGIKTAPTAQEQFALAKQDFDKKHYLSAIEGFQKVIFNFPGTPVVDSAQYYLAMSYYENGEYELAGVEFNRLTANYPQSVFADDGQYMAGVCFFKNTPRHYGLDQEDLSKAITAMEDFIVDNPDSPLIEDARRIIEQARARLAHKQYESGLLYFKLEEYVSAAIYFQLVVDNYTNSEYAARALFKLAEIAYKTGKLPEALEKFNNFINVYPSDKLVPMAKEYAQKIALKLNEPHASDETK